MIAKKISLDLQLLPYKDGVRLYAPEVSKNFLSESEIESYTLCNLVKIPACLALLDGNSTGHYYNDQSLLVCGHNSLKSAIGKTIEDVTDKISAEKVLNSHQQTLQSARTQFIQEEVFFNHGIQNQFLSILLPWYDQNKIMGLVSCNILIGQHPLGEVLSTLRRLGYLDKEKSQTNQFITAPIFDSVYLSTREKQCLFHYCRGKSAKDIGKILALSCRTIEHYLENLKNKLGVNTKSDLINLFLN